MFRRWIKSGSHWATVDPATIRIPAKGLVLPKQGKLEWQNRARGQGFEMAHGYLISVMTFSGSIVCFNVSYLSVMNILSVYRQHMPF